MSEWRGVAGAASESPAATECAPQRWAEWRPHCAARLRLLLAQRLPLRHAGGPARLAPRARGAGRSRAGCACCSSGAHEAAQEVPAGAAGAPREAGRALPCRARRRRAASASCWGTGRGTRTSAPCTRSTWARCSCLRRRCRRRGRSRLRRRPRGCRCSRRRRHRSRRRLCTLQPLRSPRRRQARRLPWPQTRTMCLWSDGRSGTPCALPPGAPPPALNGSACGRRKRDAVSRAERPGGRKAQSVAAPASVRGVTRASSPGSL
jgi:hypothetical protein